VSSVAERRIVDAVCATMGDVPVLLCGSRATGSASPMSDYDVLVGVPRLRLPFVVRCLEAAAAELNSELGVPVSLSPVPLHILRRRRPNLFVWKVQREARVLRAPAGFERIAPRELCLDGNARFSYLASALWYLLGDVGEGMVPAANGGTRKALLHLVQLRLLERNSYSSNLEQALVMLGDQGLADLAVRIHTTDAWFELRDVLVDELEHTSGRCLRAGRVNIRYGALSALRGRCRVRAALSQHPIDRRLGRLVAALARAVRVDAEPDPDQVRAAAARVPPGLRAEATWRGLVELVRHEWPSAHPLIAQ
jgi:predicted nucleotidyltransferase